MSRKSEKLFDGITNIDDEIIEGSQEKTVEKKKSPKRFVPAIAAAAAVCVCGAAVGIFAYNNGKTPETSENAQQTTAAAEYNSGKISEYLLAKAVYPEMPQYPEESRSNDPAVQQEEQKKHEEWWNKKRALRDQPDGYADGIDSFLSESITEMMSARGTDNKVYSPMSAYMALAMSAEISGGNTRQQILDLLGQDSIESLRSHANSIWQANYSDDGMAKCVLASSLWLRDDMKYDLNTINTLASNYYSSVFGGKPGTAEYDAALQAWLNEQTSGQLENYVEGIKLDPKMVLTLATTVDYAGKWLYKFNESGTKESVFHSPTGDITCDFMNKHTEMSYFVSEKFASVSLPLEQNGAMRLILPDEGITPEELLKDEAVIKFLTKKNIYEDFENKYCEIELSVPKFDVSCDTDLSDMLKKIGVTDAFNGSVSDFSPLTEDQEGIFISSAKHAARVQIDEEGCRASVLTIMQYSGAMLPDGKAEFILDRPFIFEIVSATGFPLFVGIVNNP